jgi:hypothetical protein
MTVFGKMASSYKDVVIILTEESMKALGLMGNLTVKE